MFCSFLFCPSQKRNVYVFFFHSLIWLIFLSHSFFLFFFFLCHIFFVLFFCIFLGLPQFFYIFATILISLWNIPYKLMQLLNSFSILNSIAKLCILDNIFYILIISRKFFQQLYRLIIFACIHAFFRFFITFPVLFFLKFLIFNLDCLFCLCSQKRNCYNNCYQCRQY